CASNTSWYHAIAAAASRHERYGVSACRRAGVYSRTSGTGAPSGGFRVRPSASTMRARRRTANSGRGASGTGGSARDSKGSVIVGAFVVTGAEGAAGAHEQRLGRVHGATEMVGDVGHRQAVEIAQRERGAVMRAERRERRVHARAFEALV